MAQLCHHEQEFRQLGVEIVLISFGAPEVARVWLEEKCPSFRLLIDADRASYRAYGLERSWRRSWNFRTLWRYLQLLSSGRKWQGIKGDSTQLGGDVIVGNDRTVHLVYRSYDPTDRPSASYLLDLLRGIDSDAKTG